MRGNPSRAAAAAVAALTLLALGLRLVGLKESLFVDEVYTFRIVANYGFLDVIDQVHDTAITPPLHYLLAWAAVQLGEPSVWIRVPSIVLGTAMVPAVYLLGLRTVGRPAAVVGATLAAIAPFAVFYGTEARAYGTMMLLGVLAALSLLKAVETGRGRWFAAYAACVVLVLYSHYSGVFLVVALAGWAFVVHRERLRPLLFAHAAIVLAYLPWVPSYFFQSEEHPPTQIALVAPVTLHAFKDALLAAFPGRPFVLLEDVPGPVGLWLLGASIGIGGLALVWRLARAGEDRSRLQPSRGVLMVALLAVVTPLGIAVYSLAETSLFGPRNFAASLPFAWLLIGWLVTAARGIPAVVASALVLGVVGFATVESLDDRYRRPPYRLAAEYVDARADRCDPVVEVIWRNPGNAIAKALSPHFQEDHPAVRIRDDDRAAWRGAARSRRVFVVAPQVSGIQGVSWAGRLGGGFRLKERSIDTGVIDVGVYEYERDGEPSGPPRLVRSGDGEAIALPSGAALPVRPLPSSGAVEVIHAQFETFKVSGWAVDPVARRPARRVLVFDDGCPVLEGRPTEARPDVAEAQNEPRLERSGFNLTVIPGDAARLSRSSGLRAFGLSGPRAWELPVLPGAFHEPQV